MISAFPGSRSLLAPCAGKVSWPGTRCSFQKSQDSPIAVTRSTGAVLASASSRALRFTLPGKFEFKVVTSMRFVMPVWPRGDGLSVFNGKLMQVQNFLGRMTSKVVSSHGCPFRVLPCAGKRRHRNAYAFHRGLWRRSMSGMFSLEGTASLRSTSRIVIVLWLTLETL